MVIQRTDGQDRRRKSLILNGARTDIMRELEIDGGRKRRGGNERARYIVKSGAAEEIYRDPMSRIERSTGLSCSTILAERERERSRRIGQRSSSSSRVHDTGTYIPHAQSQRGIICSVVIAIHRSFNDFRSEGRELESACFIESDNRKIFARQR